MAADKTSGVSKKKTPVVPTKMPGHASLMGLKRLMYFLLLQQLSWLFAQQMPSLQLMIGGLIDYKEGESRRSSGDKSVRRGWEPNFSCVCFYEFLYISGLREENLRFVSPFFARRTDGFQLTSLGAQRQT